MVSEKTCLNCQNTLIGYYCANCGQSAEVRRITFKDTLSDFLSSTFAIEGPLLRTTKELILNPGKVYREFLAGKRKKYYKPVAYFIVMTAIYIILRSILGYDPLEGQVEKIGAVDDRAMIYWEASRFMTEYINHILFSLAISIGLSLKLLFSRRYNLAEFTVVGFYMTGVYILIGIPFMVFNHVTGFRENEIQLLFLMFIIIYSTSRLIGDKGFLAYFKYLLAGVFSLIGYMLIGYGISLLIVILRQ